MERLEHYHIQWDVFYSREELLEYKKKCENDYDLYIFDVEMPGMNGIELAARIRKEDVRAIFVFLTSHTEYALSAIDVITLAYIQKPITPEKVNELFEQQLSVWEMARNNFEGLKTVQIREFDFDGFAVKVQFNPARMVSSGAKVDAKTIPTNLTKAHSRLVGHNFFMNHRYKVGYYHT